MLVLKLRKISNATILDFIDRKLLKNLLKKKAFFSQL